MIKALEQAILKVRNLPEEKQRLAAELLEEFAAAKEETYALSPAEREAVREGLEQAARGEFASDEEVEVLLRRPWT